MTETNELFNLAEQWVNETNQNIFLTGKAGTGKTTFLRHIKDTTPKRSVVLAPTGVAAINAGGSTIHSFFRIPFATFIPAYNNASDMENVVTPLTLFSRLRYNRQHIQILRTLELIIIDEVSMVRADVLDMIDLILKKFRFASHLPFGGVQMLFIGDMHQLPPVVKDYEARLLGEYYRSAYFFDAQALRKNEPVMVELKKVYRQQEEQFLGLLNELRHNQLSEDNYQRLSQKVTSVHPHDEKYITLASHVFKADRINEKGMNRLQGKEVNYKAIIEGEFPEFQYPAATDLKLKIGARVMFIKNHPDKRFYNGRIGTVTLLEEDSVWVICDDDKEELKVMALPWEHVKYAVDKQSGELNENIEGRFTQIPLRLAWAVTIHKSQGLTFDHVVIDAEKAFASGQVYVALSRCRTWEGIVLLSHIQPSSLFTDVNIINFSEQVWKEEKLQNTLPEYRHNFQTQTLQDAFNLEVWKRYNEQMMRVFSEHENSFPSDAKDLFNKLSHHLHHISNVAEKFILQLKELNNLEILPEENKTLHERINAACSYFIRENESHVLSTLKHLPAPPDNANAGSKMLQSLDAIRENAFMHQAIWTAISERYTAKAVLQARAKALHNISQLAALKWIKTGREIASDTTSTTSDQQMLEQALRTWRAKEAELLNVEVYRIISNKAITGIVNEVPKNRNELLAIKGIGHKKIKEYGDEILGMIGKYFELKLDEELPAKKLKTENGTLSETYFETLKLVESGMQISEVAKSRNLAETTIGGHIAKLITHGKITLTQFITAEKVAFMKAVIALQPDEMKGLTPLKEKLGDDYSWDEIKWVLAEMKKDSLLCN